MGKKRSKNLHTLVSWVWVCFKPQRDQPQQLEKKRRTLRPAAGKERPHNVKRAIGPTTRYFGGGASSMAQIAKQKTNMREEEKKESVGQPHWIQGKRGEKGKKRGGKME